MSYLYVYAAQVNRQKLNEIIDAFKDQMKIKIHYSPLQRFWHNALDYTYMHTMLACLRDSITYMRQVVIHTMDYVDAATTNI